MGSLEISGSTISWNTVENCLRVRREVAVQSQRPVSALPGRAACVGEGPGRGCWKRCGQALPQAPGEPWGVWRSGRPSGPGWAGPAEAGERS